jgi:hypothetical protein
MCRGTYHCCHLVEIECDSHGKEPRHREQKKSVTLWSSYLRTKGTTLSKALAGIAAAILVATWVTIRASRKRESHGVLLVKKHWRR